MSLMYRAHIEVNVHMIILYVVDLVCTYNCVHINRGCRQDFSRGLVCGIRANHINFLVQQISKKMSAPLQVHIG